MRVSPEKLRRGIDLVENIQTGDIQHYIKPINSVMFYCNKTNLPEEAFIDGDINYFMILKKLILPFFSIKSRIISVGKVFKIGNFEFQVFHCEPKIGKITKNSGIYCTKSNFALILVIMNQINH